MFEARFQSFDESADPTQGPARLAALRAELARRGLDGFVVPRADEHQNEYVPPSAERLAWLTGFTGSAGVAVVLAAEAAVFVDGRYNRAGAPADRQRAPSRPSPWLDRPPDRPGSGNAWRRGSASASTPGCTHPRRSSA